MSGALGNEQLTETVHTIAANHTVPNTAVNREDSDDWEDRVQCEVGAVAVTELDKNISHGFSSDQVLRGSQENPNIPNTETDVTGS